MKPRGELWLVRHGATEWTHSGQHTSRTDLALTPDGEQQAHELKRMLAGKKFALVLSSPMRRALETCRFAGYEPEITTDLCEWDYGDYEGLTTDQIEVNRPGWTIWTGAPPNGETADQVGARVDRVIARGIAAGGDVALFGHGHVLRILAARWLGLDPHGGKYLALSTASISVLGYEHETHVVDHWNEGCG